jgi:membrane protease YdiL (CAAX protease family)
MYIPGIVTVIYLLVTKRGFRKIGWGFKKWKYIFPAVFIPLVVSLIVMFVILYFNWGEMTQKLFVFNDGYLENSYIQLILGKHKQTILYFILNVTLSHIVFLIIGGLFALGEELAWRGLLQEYFLRKYGFIYGFLLIGIIWGYWHLPIILMGYNFPEHPVLGGLVLMPLGTIFLSVFLGWLYLRSQSIWMPSLAHASGNLFSGFIFMIEISHGSTLRGILWISAWGIVAALCMINLLKNKPDFWQVKSAITDNKK